MTFPNKKIINTELFFEITSALYIGDTWIRDSGGRPTSGAVDWEMRPSDI